MKAVVVLGHKLEDAGLPTKELRERLNLGIELFTELGADALVFSGGMANSSAGVTEAKAMKEYAISKGIPSHKVILEEKSLDTIGNAIFTKELVRGRFNGLCVVTSCYHVHRASFIFKRVFGEDYKLNFDYCALTGEGKFEDIKLNQAEIFFKGINPGDDKELRRRILKHKLHEKGVKCRSGKF